MNHIVLHHRASLKHVVHMCCVLIIIIMMIISSIVIIIIIKYYSELFLFWTQFTAVWRWS